MRVLAQGICKRATCFPAHLLSIRNVFMDDNSLAYRHSLRRPICVNISKQERLSVPA